MAFWISSVVLSALAVITLGFPQPDDSAYNIPSVGTGQRSQYYVGHTDGSYKYGYDTGDGAFESVKLKGDGQLDGQFGYTDPEGNDIRLEYESGTSGFVARGSHIPQPPAEVAQAIAAARTRTTPFVDPLASHGSDASFGFGFKDDAYSRNEEADEDGTVRGSYTYTDDDGVTRTYNYRAGSGIGFVIEGNDFSQSGNGESPASTRLTGSPSRTRVTSASSSGSRLTGSSGTRSSTSSSGTRASTGFSGTRSSTSSSGYSGTRASGATSGTRATSSNNNYSGSKHKTSAAFNSITVNKPSTLKRPSTPIRLPSRPVGAAVRATRPSTSFTSPVRQPNYRPSSTSSSFNSITVNRPSIIKRPSTPLRLPSRPVGAAVRATTATRPSTSFKSQTVNQRNYSPASTSSAIFKQTSLSNQNRPFEEANVRSSQSNDGSYSFNYQTSSHSRNEAADSNNNVKGDFAFVADDDQQNREIKYEAGSSTGFIAEGAHIPVGPVVPGAPGGQPTGAFARTQPKDFVDPLADTSSDSSYGFGFQDETYSRTEEANEDGTVSGSYSYTDEDGITRSYRYRAGKGIGFVIEGTDFARSDDGESPASTTLTGASSTSSVSSTRLPLSPIRGSYSGSSVRNPGSGLRPSTSFRPTATSGSSTSFNRLTTTASRPSTSITQTASSSNKIRPFEEANVRSSQSNDGSYSFNYQTSSHSRNEAADSNNNVKGDFAFVADDDQQNREIKYEAGSSTGFIAEGAHIPVGPVVPGAPGGQPTGAFARTQPKDFVDPLADTSSDSSYGFGFQDDAYSRTEEANEDGTVSGSYSYTDEDGITRTYRYRAGKGIGFVIEGTDFVQSDDGESPASTTLIGASSSSSVSSTRLTGSSNQQQVSTGSRYSGSSVRNTGSNPTSISTGTRFSGSSSHSSSSGSSSARPSSTRGGYSGSSVRNTGSNLRPSTPFRPTATSATASVRGSSHPNPLKSTFKPSSTSEVFPGFTLHQYDQSNSDDKFGYVLKFD